MLYFSVNTCFVFFLLPCLLLWSEVALVTWIRGARRISFHRLHKSSAVVLGKHLKCTTPIHARSCAYTLTTGRAIQTEHTKTGISLSPLSSTGRLNVSAPGRRCQATLATEACLAFLLLSAGLAALPKAAAATCFPGLAAGEAAELLAMLP